MTSLYLLVISLPRLEAATCRLKVVSVPRGALPRGTWASLSTRRWTSLLRRHDLLTLVSTIADKQQRFLIMQ